MQRKSILKDTIQLTVVQFFLEWVSLLLNVWLTHRIGAATVGIVALTGSFFQLAAVAANGNGFLCTSRFVSEELGKPNGNPNRVLGYAIGFCLLLGIPVSALIFCSAEPLSLRFLKSADLAAAVRIFTLILPLGGVCSCLKGYLNAVCRVADPAICDIVECLSRCGVLMLLLQLQSVHTNASVCMAMAYSTGCSTILGFFCLLEKPPSPYGNMFALFWQIHSCSDTRFIRRMLNSCSEQHQRCFDSGHAPTSWKLHGIGTESVRHI